MASEINIPDTPNSRQRVSLLGTTYFLEFKYNTRQQSWSISVLDELENPLLEEIKIQPNQNITGRFIKEGLPDGNFYCVKAKDTEESLGRDNFGFDKDYALLFVPDSELA